MVPRPLTLHFVALGLVPSLLAQLTTADDDNSGESDMISSLTKSKKAKTKGLVLGTALGGEDVKTKRKGCARKGKAPIGQRAKGSGGTAGGGTIPFAMRTAIADPSQQRHQRPSQTRSRTPTPDDDSPVSSPAPHSLYDGSSAFEPGGASSSEDENRALNAPTRYHCGNSSQSLRERFSQTSTVASVHEDKTAALEGEIRRLQHDVVHHRASEANLRAALDATSEAWRRESGVRGGDDDEVHVRLAASFDAQVHLQETLSRELKFRRATEEDCDAARRECSSIHAELERVKRDANGRLLVASTGRNELMGTLHRVNNAREAADEACKDVRAQLITVEAELVKRNEELTGSSARAHGTADNLKNELKSARLEATQARARVEITLQALAGAKEAEMEARKSETNAVGLSQNLATQLHALRDELNLTGEQHASFSAVINANLRNANEELQRATKERAYQDNLLLQAKTECIEAKAECGSLFKTLRETETKARGEVEDLQSALQASESRAVEAECTLQTLTRTAVSPFPQQATGGDGVGGSATPDHAQEALELLGVMSSTVDLRQGSLEIYNLDTSSAEVNVHPRVQVGESHTRHEGKAEAKFIGNKLRELTGEEPSSHVPDASLKIQMQEAYAVHSMLEEKLANTERENLDLHRRVDELDIKCREMALTESDSRSAEIDVPVTKLDPSADLAKAIQMRDMADAQASMLRSCLEDTEEMLEESRSALCDMEQNMKTLKAAQQQQATADAMNDDASNELRVRAEDAEKNAASAIRRAGEAMSKLSTMEVRLEEAKEIRGNTVAEHRGAVYAFETSSKDAEEAANAMVAEHLEAKRSYEERLKEMAINHDAILTEHQATRSRLEKRLKEMTINHDDMLMDHQATHSRQEERMKEMVIQHEGTATEHQAIYSGLEERLKEEEAARRVGNSEVERLQAAGHKYNTNLESVREALHEAVEKSTVSNGMLKHAEHANCDLDEQLAQSRTEMKSLRDELHQAQNDRFTIEETLNGAMHDIGEALTQKEDLMNQVDDLQDRLVSAQTELATIESAKEIAVAGTEDARVAAEQALEHAHDTEVRMELLREDLAATAVDSQEAKQEVESVHLRLAHAEMIVAGADNARVAAKQALEQAHDAEARVEDAEVRMELLREDLATAAARSQESLEEVKSLHLRLAHVESQLKANEAEAELRENGNWLTSGVEPAVREFSSVAVQVGSRLVLEHDARSSANAMRALEVRLQAETDLNARLNTDLDAAEIKAQAADAMIASMTNPEPIDEMLHERFALLQDEIVRLKAEQSQTRYRETQHDAAMEQMLSRRDDEAVERAAAETAVARLQVQLKMALEDDSKETVTALRAMLTEALDAVKSELTKRNKLEAQLEAAGQRLTNLTLDADAASRSAGKIEIDCACAKQRAMEADTALAEFQKEARAASELANEQFVVATQAAAEAVDAKNTAESEIERVKVELKGKEGELHLQTQIAAAKGAALDATASEKAEKVAAAAEERERRLVSQRDAAFADTRKVKDEMDDLREVWVVVKHGASVTQQLF